MTSISQTVRHKAMSTLSKTKLPPDAVNCTGAGPTGRTGDGTEWAQKCATVRICRKICAIATEPLTMPCACPGSVSALAKLLAGLSQNIAFTGRQAGFAGATDFFENRIDL